MSTRYTQKDAVSAFQRILQATGERQATAWNDVGGWALDYSEFGGYVIELIDTPGGGVHHPFGDRRRTAREFWDFANAFCLGASYRKEAPSEAL